MLIASSGDEMARAYVVNSGSEAVEAALKLARQYHMEKALPEAQRTHFIARQQSYHGTTLGTLAVGGHTARRALYEGILSTQSSRVSPCYPYRGTDGRPESMRDYVDQLEAELEAEFQRVGPEKVAAFIAEPVAGVALGCVPAIVDYFKAVRRVCDRHGALLIFDEIMCGSGRTGPEPTEKYPQPLHAWQDPTIGVVPDIMTLGKGLGGGYVPVAAMLASHRVIDRLHLRSGAFSHAQTYQGHALACRAALQVQKVIRDEGLMMNLRRQGALLGRLLEEKANPHWAVGNIRGKGLFWGIEFVKDKATKEPFHPSEQIATGVQQFGKSGDKSTVSIKTFEGIETDHAIAMQDPYNLSVLPGSGTVDGYYGDHIVLAPAYNVSEEDVRLIVDSTLAAITDFFDLYSSKI